MKGSVRNSNSYVQDISQELIHELSQETLEFNMSSYKV